MLEAPHRGEYPGFLWFFLIATTIQTAAAIIGVFFDILGYFTALRS